MPYNAAVRVLVSHCDHRPSEAERFRAAWLRAGGEEGELVFVTPSTAAGLTPPSAAFDGLLLAGGPDVEPWRFGADAGARCGAASGPCARRPGSGAPGAGRAGGVAGPGDLLRLPDPRRPPRAARSCRTSSGPAGPVTRFRSPTTGIAHDVIVSPNARFLAAAGGRFAVNSRHHQAVAEPGDGLSVVARAADGVVEAIEAETGDRFVLGVQWHPENMSQQDHVAIFRAFRAACLAGVSDRGRGPRYTGRR